MIAVTGGPGAGKSAVIEFARRNFCHHVVELPEAASIIFGGGFGRRESLVGKRAAQRAIFYVQRELEQVVLDENEAIVALCDRGTVDGAAYWPRNNQTLWQGVNVKREEEILRYHAVIHLRPPASFAEGYNHQNHLRTESPQEANEIDQRIEEAWSGHPNRFFIESSAHFLEKVVKTIRVIEGLLPSDCRSVSQNTTATV